jgi:hypothetical protein
MRSILYRLWAIVFLLLIVIPAILIGLVKHYVLDPVVASAIFLFIMIMTALSMELFGKYVIVPEWKRRRKDPH